MDQNRWLKLRQILDGALELALEDRRPFVKSQCVGDADMAREVYSILDAYESGGDRLQNPVAQLTLDPTPRPERVGSYRISETLGEGGMGVVYLGHRDDETFRKDVAVKVLRAQQGGSELQRRFSLERQILADLEHPNIARLLDGGTTDDGLPFLVIELVHGKPIHDYCRDHDLSIEQRLELVLKVCEAIQYAHRNLVVHRDLKPSNILVTEQGEPKLLDFGIAKMLQPESVARESPWTRTGVAPMTPEYASPEQVKGESVTTGTDVYALGLLIYELLCDRRPFDFSGRSLQAIVDLVCRHLPPKPSMVWAARAEQDEVGGWARRRSRRLSGDLDAIVLRALEKDPADRYGSVAQLAEDLRRHLTGLPLEARRGSPGYLLSKFVRRNRWAVGSVVGLFLVMAGFIAVVLTMQHRIVAQRDQTLHQRQRAEQVSGWLQELFELPAPSRSKGQRVTAVELLTKGARSIEGEIADLQLKAVLLTTMGNTHVKMGLLREGIDLLTQSVQLTRRIEPVGSEHLRERLELLSEALTLQGELQRAEVVARELLARAERWGDGGAGKALALARLGHLRDLLGAEQQAGDLLARARAAAEASGDPTALAKVLEYSGDERMGRGDSARAREHYQDALGLLLAEHGELHPDVVLLKSSLAAAEQSFNPDRAERLFGEAIAGQRRLFDGAHPILATALNNLGLLYLKTGRYAEAEPFLAEAVAMQENLYGDRHPKYAVMLGNLATAERFLGRLDRAELRMRRALEIFETRLGDEHRDLALTFSNLAELLLQRGRLDEATSMIQRAGEVADKAFQGDHPHLTSILNTRGQVEWANGDLAKAAATFGQAIKLGAGSRKGEDPTLPSALANYADAQKRLGDLDSAGSAMRRALSLIEARGEKGRRRLEWLTWLADLELSAGRFAVAEVHGREAYESWRRQAGDEDVWTLSAQKLLATALMEQGMLEEAGDLLESLVVRLEAAQPTRPSRLKAARSVLAELKERKRSTTLNR